MPELPKYVVIQVSAKSFIVGRLPIGQEVYEKVALTETETAARQLSRVLGGAKRKTDGKLRTKADGKQRKTIFPRDKQRAPRKERQVRLPKAMKPTQLGD